MPISLAGPIFNFLFSIIIMFIASILIFNSITYYEYNNVIIVNSNKYIKDYQDIINNKNIIIRKTDNDKMIVKGKPILISDVIKRNKLQKQHISFFKTIKESTGKTYRIIHLLIVQTINVLSNINKNKKNLSGPIGIAKISKAQISKGLINFLFLLSSLSFSLGFFNLIPLPILDGGRFIISFVESIFFIKIPSKILTVINLTSVISLLILIIFITYNDVIHY